MWTAVVPPAWVKPHCVYLREQAAPGVIVEIGLSSYVSPL